MENSTGSLTIPPTAREKRGPSSRSAKFSGDRCQVTPFSLDMATQPVRRTGKRHTEATRLKHASSVRIQLFTSFFHVISKKNFTPIGSTFIRVRVLPHPAGKYVLE